MKTRIHILKSAEELAEQFAGKLMDRIENSGSHSFHLAISGGKTPDLLFSILAKRFADSPLWQKLHIWWVDERMVVPTDPESNFGMANKLLFSKISIPEENIHRIKGENDPDEEALSYSAQIQQKLPQSKSWPVFDLILLGMGDDGHTASIFPDQLELLESESVCAVAVHPQSRQKRVTLTGKVLNNADSVIFLVTGSAKAERITEILNNKKEAGKLPAFYIKPAKGILDWYLDKEAIRGISA